MDSNEKKFEQLQADVAEISKKIASIPSEKQMQTQIMEMMHKYNEIKDAAQTVIGALAHLKGVTFKSLHEELKVPFD